jgi:hypothetical protein
MSRCADTRNHVRNGAAVQQNSTESPILLQPSRTSRAGSIADLAFPLSDKLRFGRHNLLARNSPESAISAGAAPSTQDPKSVQVPAFPQASPEPGPERRHSIAETWAARFYADAFLAFLLLAFLVDLLLDRQSGVRRRTWMFRTVFGSRFALRLEQPASDAIFSLHQRGCCGGSGRSLCCPRPSPECEPGRPRALRRDRGADI